jgi:hypothetical protein
MVGAAYLPCGPGTYAPLQRPPVCVGSDQLSAASAGDGRQVDFAYAEARIPCTQLESRMPLGGTSDFFPAILALVTKARPDRRGAADGNWDCTSSARSVTARLKYRCAGCAQVTDMSRTCCAPPTCSAASAAAASSRAAQRGQRCAVLPDQPGLR